MEINKVDIKENAFFACTSLRSIEIPNSVKIIGKWAFMGCTALNSIKFSSSVSSIHEVAFLNCRNIASIIVDEGNLVYDSRNNCNAVMEKSTNTLVLGCKNTKIPETVKIIGISAFEGCEGLKEIEIPNSVVAIEKYAFSGCEGIVSVIIPDSVTTIGECAFYGCENLVSINVDEDNQNYSSIDGVLFDKKNNTLIQCPGGKSGKYTGTPYAFGVLSDQRRSG